MTVVFTKTGLAEEKYGETVELKRVKQKTVLTHLRDGCKIEEGVTLLDIFRTVSQYKKLVSFLSQYSWCRSIEDFHAQAEEPNYDEADEEPDEKIDYLEVFWASDYGTDAGKNYLNCEPGFHGVSVARGKYAKDSGDDGLMRWGISTTPMYALAHLPVKLNQEVNLFPDKFTPGEEYKPFLTADRSFSLLDVLDSIYWEISFHGDPQSKKEFSEEMRARLKEIDSGMSEGIPIEQVFGDMQPKEGGMKIVIHPDLLRDLGIDPEDFKKEE